jgi:hypothetical protein
MRSVLVVLAIVSLAIVGALSPEEYRIHGGGVLWVSDDSDIPRDFSQPSLPVCQELAAKAQYYEVLYVYLLQDTFPVS